MSLVWIIEDLVQHNIPKIRVNHFTIHFTSLKWLFFTEKHFIYSILKISATRRAISTIFRVEYCSWDFQ